jgi:hypothetical protein
MNPKTLDEILTLQIAVAWAGEGGESPRLGWWRTDMVNPDGGEDLFKQLLPSTWRWAVLEATREAAHRADAVLRSRAHDPDTLVSLYRFGFEVDEQVDQRLADLKGSGAKPTEALPSLAEVIRDWDRDAFARWLTGRGQAETKNSPAGRMLVSALPEKLDQAAIMLAAALVPLNEEYPLPHFRRHA